MDWLQGRTRLVQSPCVGGLVDPILGLRHGIPILQNSIKYPMRGFQKFKPCVNFATS